MDTFFGYKIAQSQTFNDKGNRLVVTKLATKPVETIRLKTEEKDGYISAIVKIGDKKKAVLREIRLKEDQEVKVGDKLTVDQIFKEGDLVSVTGRVKGRGFAGVMKRWGFSGGPRTHGQSDRERAPGSIGQGTDPGRVWKGKKMAGRMGGKNKTIKGLQVFKIDKETSQLWITGLVPGVKGELIEISKLK